MSGYPTYSQVQRFFVAQVLFAEYQAAVLGTLSF